MSVTPSPVEIEFIELSEFEEPTIPCETPQFASDTMPDCHPNEAEWIAFRSIPCDCGIVVRLICNDCRVRYQEMMAARAHLYCPLCLADTNGFDRFEPLKQGT